MSFFAILILVAIAGFVSIALERRAQERKLLEQNGEAPPRLSTAETISDIGSNLAQRVAGGVRGLQDQILMVQQPTKLEQPFRVWVVGEFRKSKSQAHQQVADWLAALPDKGMAVLVQRLTAFCADLGFDLAWVVDNRLEQTAELRDTVTKVVLSYCQACYEAISAQADIAAFQTIDDYFKNPGGGKNQLFAQKLVAKLIEEGLVSLSITDYLSMPYQARQAQMKEAIETALQNNSDQFYQIVKTLVFAEASDIPPEGKPGAPPAATPEQPKVTS